LDGVRTGLIVLSPTKTYTAAKYFYAEPTGHIATAMWVSRAWFDKLPANLQAAVLEVGRAMADPACLVAIEINDRARKTWTDNGGEITEPTPEDRAIIVARARALTDEFLGSDPRVKDMYALVKQAAADTAGAKPPR
jgi:TRAP-type C4-dicarboxylate transport system substrate-binding protein